MIAFIIAEAKAKDPMVNLKMFKKPHFIGVVIVAFALGAGFYAYNAFLTALMQNYIGYSATQTGVRQLVMSVWSLVLGPIVGILSARYSKKWMISISMFVGTLGFWLMARAISPTVSFVDLWPGMVFMGIANGMVNPLLNTAGMEGIPANEMGMASGLLNVFRQLGTTIGVVVLGLLQDNQYETYLNNHLSSINMPAPALSGLKKALIDAGPFSGHGIAFSNRLSHAPFAQDFQRIVIHAYDNGMITVAISSAILALIGGIAAAVLLQRNPKSVEIPVKQPEENN